MPYTENKGIHIHYKIEGEGTPLVLQHGSLNTMESWYEAGYVAALKNDYQLILLDARGHGGSDKPHSPEAYELKKRVEDIVAVLDDVGIAKAHYFGYSMGGWIGFGVAHYAPERFQSLIIGGQHPYSQNMDGVRQFVQYGVENGPERFVAMWERELGLLSSEARERMLAYDFATHLVIAQDRDSLEAVLPTIRIPCMLYAGEIDDAYPLVKKCAEQIANVTFVTLPGLDHRGAFMRIDEVLPHVKKFLAEVSAA